ncbi:hypothetical protein GQ43DRAFT_304264 [Delitschia confertaspora ATCC 74209]|uniref:Uncharacterized protein n=1 Tax=Delitschia confertaspora ATCC 74209 TaxID=1513339 RepID=A0A9P4JP63_9PLEO|nr:hypothetical protein GQ43DRAFT_304264 [Delitschia confertaspora ATCC 74209]
MLPIPEDAKEVRPAHAAVMEACRELKDLMIDPREFLQFSWTAFVSIKVILRFDLHKEFLVGETPMYKELATLSGLTPRNVPRLVRHAIVNHNFFQELSPGVVTHSALTALLVKDESLRA